MANDKVFSARADEATIEKMNQIAEESGMKKAEILPALIAAWEANTIREALPGRATEIDNVHNLLIQIEHAYTASLELNVNAENRIRTEFEARISSSEQAVASLKEAVVKAQEKATASNTEIKAMKEARDHMAEELAKANDIIKTKTETIDGLKATKESMEHRIVELEKKLSGVPDVEVRAKAAEAEVENLKRQVAKAEQEYQKKIWQIRDQEIDARELMRSKLIKKLDENAERYNIMQKQLSDALNRERQKTRAAEDNARAKMEAALDKAEKRHEAEMSRLLDRIDRLRWEDTDDDDEPEEP